MIYYQLIVSAPFAFPRRGFSTLYRNLIYFITFILAMQTSQGKRKRNDATAVFSVQSPEREGESEGDRECV